MTPQLRQAIKLLQMSTTELEVEIAEAVETNPLLEWADEAAHAASEAPVEPSPSASNEERQRDEPAPAERDDDWSQDELQWTGTGSGGSFDDDDNGDAAERVAESETLADHLLWQLHLSPLSPRDRQIGAILIDALDEDGYLREPLSAILETLNLGNVDEAEVLTVLHQIQRFDPVGIGARSLGECLALQLVRSLDPRPGKQISALSQDTYVVPDCVIWRQRGVWRAALAGRAQPKVTIHRGYEQLIRSCGESDAGYLRGQLQEARWLLKSLEARGETLLRVVRCLLQHQAGFLEFGAQALRPLTLREIAGELGLHESTISRAIARKYVRTPRGTIPLRSFFASGIDTDSGGEASSTAIQAMIRRLIDAENPRKPLSDAKLADLLKTSGVPVARRTVAKYREAMNISASHERVRIA